MLKKAACSAAFSVEYGMVGWTANCILAAKYWLGRGARIVAGYSDGVCAHAQAGSLVVDGCFGGTYIGVDHVSWCIDHHGWSAASVVAIRHVPGDVVRAYHSRKGYMSVHSMDSL